MNNELALDLLAVAMAEYRALPYASLAERVDGDDHRDVVGPDGRSYQVEVQVMWAQLKPGPVLVIGSVDDGGWRAWSPLTRSFVMRPDGSFVGEDR